jgi:Na+/phosphate symporter
VISRYLVIALAVGATLMQVSRQAWLEATGLAALAAGLIILNVAATRPALKPLAWAAFATTAVTMVVVFVRMQGG